MTVSAVTVADINTTIEISDVASSASMVPASAKKVKNKTFTGSNSICSNGNRSTNSSSCAAAAAVAAVARVVEVVVVVVAAVAEVVVVVEVPGVGERVGVGGG